MALKKTKTLPNGTSGNYWKIISEKYDRVSKILKVEIALFKDSSLSQSGKHLGLVKTFEFPMTIQESIGNRTAQAYVKIRDKANTQLTHDMLGRELSQPVPFDIDLSNSESI